VQAPIAYPLILLHRAHVFVPPLHDSRPASPDSPPIWLTPDQCKSLEDAGTTAHRLGSGPGGWVERLGDVVNISYKSAAALEELLAGLAEQSAASGWKPARIFTRFLPVKNAERTAPVLHSGDATLPWTMVVTEGGVRYGIDLAAGYSHGLFLDQRKNRARLAMLKPKRVLNTFAHTCSFAVVDRGKENLRLNGIAETGHRFLAEDTLEVLPSLDPRRDRFDAIILDPPTFSLSKDNRRWQVENDFDGLLSAALEVAMQKCAILISTNCTKLDAASLERRARRCAKDKRLVADYVHGQSQIDFPPGHGSSTLWMMVR
jgi:23S rRNA (cytosine1962-C5)-methyltransferase